jgi:hypothetical protein
MAERYRTGRRNPRNVYRLAGPEPSDEDVCVGMLDTPELARSFVDAVNGRLGVERAAEAAICSECWFEDCRRCSGGSCAHVVQGHYEPERARGQYKDAFEAGRRAGRQEAVKAIRTEAELLSTRGVPRMYTDEWGRAARIAEGEPDGT